MSGLCLVHLARLANGHEPFQRFAHSYLAHPAGVDHHLLVVLKGFAVDEPSYPWLDAIADVDPIFLRLPDHGLDIGAYMEAARHFDFDSFCFLNSFSVILDDNWLAKMVARHHRSVGVVAATGSWESACAPDWNSRANRPAWRQAARIAALPIRTLEFPRFPNPHVRTNAFLMRRTSILQLRTGAIATKGGALRFESGRRSLTRQIRENGLASLVVGRDGVAYEPDAWPRSLTFRSGSQENLMVADNRTAQYTAADPATKAALSRYSWGTTAAQNSRH